ncbi:MAG TPA: carboxypeptidase-like regulatory domain-containing protein [Candidatus Aquilonibacter sp.]|nr:carboxypeptidase-like regulatory domain-containing protein [Candidatus Aquilonibacter sp.]
MNSEARFSAVRSIVRALLLLAVLAFLPLQIHAQDNSSVTGVVTDPTGAVVAGATVTLTNPGIGYSVTATTNSVGVYEFSNVPPAQNYALVFTKSGFETITLDGIELNVNAKVTEDARFSVGDVKTTVEVKTSETETLNTVDASIASVIDGDRIQDLPNSLVNSAANYLSLAPAVTPGGAVAGTRSDQTNITLDGLDVNDQRGGFAFTTTVNTPLDSIQELSVTVTGDDASFGHSSGGQMQLVTKSGTNDFHGQAFEFNRVKAYAANNYFNNLEGIPLPQLIRNQFGGDVGGPILKNKLFFFFSYNGLRASETTQNIDTVPDSTFLTGQLNYLGTSGNVETTPLSGPNSLASLDPQGIGADPNLLNFLTGRGYAGTAAIPAPNTSVGGDGLNTAGYFFLSPVLSHDNTYIGKIDYQASKNHRMFVRATFDRSNDTQFTQQFPGDPSPGGSFFDHSRAWSVGDTWTISPNLTNQASFGETDQVNAFTVAYEPTSPDSLNFFDGFFGTVLSQPYLGLNQQFPVVPVYQIRDTLTWVKGKHTLTFGGVIAPTIFKSGNLTDTNGFSIGVGGDLSSLSQATGCANAPNFDCLPSDFSPNGDTNEWARLFTIALGRYSNVSASYNYDVNGNALPQNQVSFRDYHSTQYEAFGQDTWSVRPDLTLTAGLRWSFHNPLSEVNGFEAIQNQTPNGLFALRLQQAEQGISGPDAVPFITYSLGGSANNAPGYYKPSYNNLGPKVSFAYSPYQSGGMLGRLFGNRQTSIRGGFGIDYDNSLIGQGFELDESSFLFSNTVPINYGNIATDPRFACANPCTPTALVASLPAVPAGGTTPRPTFTPNLDSNGFPIGFFNGGFNGSPLFNFDPNYKTPNEMHFDLGIQRELPGGWLVEATYVGKLGRNLPAIGDPAQAVNFVDQTANGPSPAGQSLYSAFGAIQKQVQQGVTGANLTPQPWFENQVSAALAQTVGAGATCMNTFGISCANVAYQLTQNGFYFYDGDVTSTIQSLADFHNISGIVEQGLLLPNVGLLAQDGGAGYVGNYSSSDYHALVVRVSHRLSHDLTMELNYTYSHSIDNDSGVQNNLIEYQASGASEICDLRNLRACRGSSDFDHRHLFNSNFLYALPLGRGKWIGGNSSKGLNELIGGWNVSGIFTAFTGDPFKIDSGAFTIDFTQTQPGVFIGTKSDVAGGIHQVPSSVPGIPNTVQYFSNVSNAESAFTFPIAGGPGNRNILNGPGLWNLDLAVLKDFAMPWSETQKLQFRTDALNVFNHTNFANPGASLINPNTFGDITGTANASRELQLGLRFMF